MFLKASILFCCQEHFGEVTFPDLADLTPAFFITPKSARQLRREAKAAGWIYSGGNDYCNLCNELERERKEQ